MSRPGDTLPHPARDPDPRRTLVTPGPAVVATDDSAVSWAAILAGAAAAASLSLILVLLGTGLGLSSVSPWSFEGVSAETFGWAAIAWIAFCSIAASGLGGYLTGRLRRRWSGVATDETYFRDTAHGFLAWGVATLITAATLTTAIGGLLGTGARAGATVAGAGISAAAGGMAAALDGDSSDDAGRGLLDYYVDHLFRDDRPAGAASAATPPARLMADDDNVAAANEIGEPSAMRQTTDARSPRLQRNARPEATRILMNSLRTSTLNADDTRYLARLVAERTGVDPATAEARVTQVHGQLVQSIDTLSTQAREAADEARKAAAYAALWLFITLLMGAFTASWLATMGGRHRDL